jgi:hypothetical protein
MFGLVFAMITLQNAAPDPQTTAPPSLASRLTGGASGTGLQGLDTTSPFGDMTVTVGCTYGAPRLTQDLVTDATSLTRTLSSPQCDDTPSYASLPALIPASYAFQRPAFTTPAFSKPETTFTLPAPPARSFAIQHLTLPADLTGSLGKATITSSATTTTPRPATLHHAPIPQH